MRLLPRPRRILVVVLAVVAGGVAFGVVRAHRSARPVAASDATAPSPSPSARPGPSLPPRPPYQWLSGKPWRPGRPVLAVKIDNVGAALPQVGLDAADVVYLEQVEYGLTRLMAIYSSAVPPRVGPVRSARTNDLELLAQYGRPVLGANAGVAADVARADLVDASADLLPAYFGRDHGRPAPHNLFLDPVALLRDTAATRRGTWGCGSGRRGRAGGPPRRPPSPTPARRWSGRGTGRRAASCSPSTGGPTCSPTAPGSARQRGAPVRAGAPGRLRRRGRSPRTR